MAPSSFCKRDACPEYKQRPQNKNKECSISGRLPGNMTACPLAPAESTPARAEALAGLERIIAVCSGPVPVTPDMLQQAIDGTLPEPAAPVWAETIAREAVAEPADPPLAEIYRIDTEIAALKRMISSLSERRGEALAEVVESGRMDQHDGAGNLYRLRARDRTVRTLEPDLLRERQPEVFEAIAVPTWSVTIADARRHLGEDEITACSSSRVSRSWIVICEQTTTAADALEEVRG